MLLVDLNWYYQHLLTEFGGEEVIDVTSRSQNLEERIRKHNGDDTLISSGTSRKGNVVYSASMSLKEAVRTVDFKVNDLKGKIREMALMLRKEIFRAKKTLLPKDLKLSDTEKEEVEIPELISIFCHNLIAGPDSRQWKGDRKAIRTQSLCEDVISIATSGQTKPKKHLMLGMTMKSLTGSRKVIEILNKLGHCDNYHSAEEIEIEMTFEANKEGVLTPHGMTCNLVLGTGLAWDNFDRFVATLTGTDTLHDTVGIAYQARFKDNIDVTNELTIENKITEGLVDFNRNLDVTSASFQVTKKIERRRAFESTGLNIEPYRKRPKLQTSDLPPKTDNRRKELENQETGNTENVVPSWIGWNSLVTPTPDHIHQVWYLPHISLSPTQHSIVADTMNRSLIVAMEASKTSIAVTYDLAISKFTMQIQNQESPKHNQLFINIGAFHIELAFFKDFGKFLGESGGPYVLQEAEVLAKSSIRSFLEGTNYKRCKIFHEVLAVALEVMLYEQYLNTIEDKDESIATTYQEIKNFKDGCKVYSKEMEEVFSGVYKFFQDTKEGKLDKTAQFWASYINFMHLYHEFTRNIRMGDLEAVISCLPKLTDIFFRVKSL